MMLRNRGTWRRLRGLGGHTTEGSGIESIAERAKQGDERAFTEIYRRYFDRVYGYMRLALNDWQGAEDATRQVLLKAIGLISGYEQRSQSFSRWLFQLAHNEALDRLRERGPGGALLGNVEHWRESVRTDGLRSHLWDSDGELMRAIEQLPRAQRKAVLLRYVLDFEDVEIAEVLGVEVKELRRLQRSALRSLERRLGKLERKPSTAANSKRSRKGVLRVSA